MNNLSIIYPSTKTKKHFLFEIDRDKKTAYCSACGWTEIHVPKASKKDNPKVFCVKRYRELRESLKHRSRSLPHWKPRHSLSEIDRQNFTAICAICGPVRVRKQVTEKYDHYICVPSQRVYKRKYMRMHYSSKLTSPHAHALSQIDEENKLAVCSKCGPVEIYIWQGKRKMSRRCSNAGVRRIPEAQKIRKIVNSEIIDAFKVNHGCIHCGYNTNSQRLSLSSKITKHPDIHDLLGLTSILLMHELGNCEVICVDCRNESPLQSLKPLSDLVERKVP